MTPRHLSLLFQLIGSFLPFLSHPNQTTEAFSSIALQRTSTVFHNKARILPHLFSTDPKQTSSSNSNNIQRPQNEFSRTYRADTIFGAAQRGRDFSVSIRAKKNELEALAKRFRLPEIANLEAELMLREDSNKKKSKGECIQAEGTVTSTLTQKCVRTNENFEVELNFRLFVEIRCSTEEGFISDNLPVESKPKKKKSKKNSRVTEKQIQEMGMKELQRLMEHYEYEQEEEDVIEDEAVFQDGLLDVGELVAQMFRLKLDPYPKKPGSEPINLTFSG